MWDELAPPWRACVEEAWAAYRAGSLPIGAAITDAEGRILARGRNRIFEASAPPGLLAGSRLAHAEMNALLALDWAAADPRACVLYTTTEPCPLCAGAVRMTRLRRVRYAARDGAGGGADLFEATPFMRRGAISAAWAGDSDLEAVLVALLAERILRGWEPGMAPAHERLAAGDPAAVVARLAERAPAGVALGRGLLESGELRRLRDAGADARAMLDALAAGAGRG